MERPWVSSPSYEAAISVLVYERTKRGLSQRDMADRLGKPQSFVAKVETKGRRIDIVEFVAWSRALGMEPGEMLELIVSSLEEPLSF